MRRTPLCLLSGIEISKKGGNRPVRTKEQTIVWHPFQLKPVNTLKLIFPIIVLYRDLKHNQSENSTESSVGDKRPPHPPKPQKKLLIQRKRRANRKRFRKTERARVKPAGMAKGFTTLKISVATRTAL